MSDLDWIKPGTEVVTVVPTRFGGPPRVRKDVIAKVGKRDVVLRDTGERFNKNYSETSRYGRTGLRRSSSHAYGEPTYLYPLDHPEAAEAIRTVRRHRFCELIEAAAREFRDTGEAVYGRKIRRLVNTMEAEGLAGGEEDSSEG